MSLTIEVQTKNENGDIGSMDLHLQTANIAAIVRPPLQPATFFFPTNRPISSNSGLPDDIENLVKMDLMGGGIVYVNPKFIDYYFAKGLGDYVLICSGETQLPVCTTERELKKILEGAPRISL